MCYHILLHEEEYKELGADFLQNRNRERTERQLINRLRSFGYEVEKKVEAI